MPLLSVIMASKNENISFLKQCTDSILNQSFKDFNFYIIIDNNDKNINFLKNLAQSQKQVFLLMNSNKPGVSGARNFGFSQSKSKYIAIIDGDDYYDINKFDKQITFLEKNKDISLVGSNLFLVDKMNKIIGERLYPENSKKIKKQFLYKMPVANPSIMLRRDALNEVGYFNEDFKKAEDFELWLRFLVYKKKMHNIQEQLVYYRTSTDFNVKRGTLHYNNYYNALKRHSKFIWPLSERLIPLILFFIIKSMPNNFLSFLLKTRINRKIKQISLESNNY